MSTAVCVGVVWVTRQIESVVDVDCVPRWCQCQGRTARSHRDLYRRTGVRGHGVYVGHAGVDARVVQADGRQVVNAVWAGWSQGLAVFEELVARHQGGDCRGAEQGQVVAR